ncbi:Uncharacterized protein OBRU01_03066 [Operophtera brumata]|uniref:Uncharacterized protein n=1 Tax=Operophtera brumata TaxID=104452 RepID=A0A0L7LRA5_OPEBR|nr:Uncharacterized protein OBRU01_03066 [Operophtera brumata]
MEPASPKHGWFERHIGSNMMFYDTGEKLAEIDDEGRGKWFYKNGMVGLDYYNAPELHAGQRYVVYSSGQELDNGKIKPLTVLAFFDFLGNGVVYDHFGNVRIKYNQTEGFVIDEKIGVPGRWKWHSLNDPPILEEVFAEPYNEGDDPCLDNLLKKHNKSQTSSYQDKDDIMEAIELDNILKAQAHKLRKKFKPFQIRMKALKINEQFSLRVLDQTHIYLLLRDGRTSLKLNLGMVLITSNIVDTATVDVASDVVTP